MNKRKLANIAQAALTAYKAQKAALGADYSTETESALQSDYDQKKAAADAEDAANGGAGASGGAAGSNGGAAGGDKGGAAGSGAGGAAGADGSKTITTEDLEKMIGKTIETALAAKLPDALKGKLTADDVATAVKAGITEWAKTNKTADGGIKQLDGTGVASIVEAAMAKALDKVRAGNKLDNQPVDEKEARLDIEYPVSWRKGNLPLHGKQLLNVLLMTQGARADGKAAPRHINEGIDEADVKRGETLGELTVATYRDMAKRLMKYGGKAMSSTGTNVGAELVPRDLSSELQRRLYLASQITAMMAAREIDMPSQPYDLPLVTDDPTYYLNSSQGTSTTNSDIPTGSLTLDAKKLMGQCTFTYELDEDSIIPILPLVQEGLANGAARSYEQALISGDTTGTHQDSDIAAISNHAAKAFKGLRKLALAVTALKKDLSGGGISEANCRAMKKAMGKYGINPRELVWIFGALGDNDAQAITNVTTMEKFGPRATLITGELADLLGVPIIVSEAMREDTNASGVYDASTTTKGSFILWRPNRFLSGRRREFTVEAFRDIQTQKTVIVASFRKSFIPLETPSATVPTVIVGYNYTA